ncbi:hypothetical protein M0805_006293 [Coniferiporia weirii]|nr:hypothetical protein M0805_006293 [Coniferiporia weirii]
MASAPAFTSNPRKQAHDSEKVKLAQTRATHSPFWVLQLRLQYARLKVDHGWQKQSLNEVENLYFHHRHQQHHRQPVHVPPELTEQHIVTASEALEEDATEGQDQASIPGVSLDTSVPGHDLDGVLVLDLDPTQRGQDFLSVDYAEPEPPGDAATHNPTTTSSIYLTLDNSLKTGAGEVRAPYSPATFSTPQAELLANVYDEDDNGVTVEGISRDGPALVVSSLSSESGSAMFTESVAEVAPFTSESGVVLRTIADDVSQTQHQPVANAAPRLVQTQPLPSSASNENATKSRVGVKHTNTQLTSTPSRSSAALTYDSFWSTHAASATSYGFGPYTNGTRATQAPSLSLPTATAARVPAGPLPTSPPQGGADATMAEPTARDGTPEEHSA